MPWVNPMNWLYRDPAPPAFGKDKFVPEDEASLFSKLVFNWLSPLLSVGASRPLQKDDLWTLPPQRQTSALADLIETNFYSRVPPENRPARLRGLHTGSGNASSGSKVNVNGKEKDKDTEKDVIPELGDAKTNRSKGSCMPACLRRKNWVQGRKPPNSNKYTKRPLVNAVHAAFFWSWWAAGAMKLCADTLNTTTPLVTKLLLAWLTESFVSANSGGPTPRGLGYGFGLGVALFVMQDDEPFHDDIPYPFNSDDGKRPKRPYGSVIWISPIQIIIGIALLIDNLGYSALVLLLGFPFQFILVRVMFKARLSGVQITDRRVRLTTEVLQGIRLIKFYAWEAFYAHQIGCLREKEVATIGRTAVARAGLISVVTVIPIVASVLSFITYALSGHDLNPAIIFSSLQYFNIIRAPLMFFPLIMSAVSDAIVALGRIGVFLSAEELEEPYVIDSSPENKWAVRAEGSFTWETVGRLEGNKFGIEKPPHGAGGGGGKGRRSGADGEKGKRGARGKVKDEVTG
ncbi:hypothetical protein EW145_g6827, partial [Phellinidium pouzarii]